MTVSHAFYGEKMEDLREVGQKAIESVNKLGASDAGDLVLGIGEIIEELRDRPELYADKLNHLEGLFREFVYGEGYELRNNRVPEEKDDDDDNILNSFTIGSHSGLITKSSSPMTLGPLSLSGMFVNNPYQSPIKVSVPPISLPIVQVLQSVPKKKPKKFKKKWWNKQI